MEQFSRDDFTKERSVVQIGVVPGRVDLMTDLSGMDFEEAWQTRETVLVADMELPVIGRADLVRNKRATGRPKDLLDANELETDKES